MTDWRGAQWDLVGQTDPYYGVLADERYLGGQLSDSTRADFFLSGEADVSAALSRVRTLAGDSPPIQRALDFGCGVGRLTMPLARAAAQVVAVDVSPAMLEINQENCRRAGIRNVRFELSRPQLEGLDGSFDFAFSFIVFQHIEPSIGYQLFDAIVSRLGANARGMLHFTTGNRRSVARRAVHYARRRSLWAHRLINVLQGRRFNTPLRAMFEYDVDRITARLRSAGFDKIALEPTDHGGFLGQMVFFASTR